MMLDVGFNPDRPGDDFEPERWAGMLSLVVRDLDAHFRAEFLRQARKAGPFRAPPRAGRNDPCPCGSGRNKCCSGAARLGAQGILGAGIKRCEPNAPMGNLATAETLALRWAEVCRDASLCNLPCKIELNAWGKIEMSPANNRRARLQGSIAVELGRQLADGQVFTENCIEARSPANSDDEIAAKTKAYLAAGAREVWVVDESGSIRYFDAMGEIAASGYPLSVALPKALAP